MFLSPMRPSRRSWNGFYGVSAKMSLPEPSRDGYIAMKSALPSRVDLSRNLKNKVPTISYSFCFIGPFAFVIEHTS